MCVGALWFEGGPFPLGATSELWSLGQSSPAELSSLRRDPRRLLLQDAEVTEPKGAKMDVGVRVEESR